MKKIGFLFLIFSLFLKVFTQPINYDDEKSLINEFKINSKTKENLLGFETNHLLAIRLFQENNDSTVLFDNKMRNILHHFSKNKKHLIYYHINGGRYLTANMIYFEIKGEKVENLIIATPSISNINPRRILFKRFIRKEIFTIDYSDRIYLKKDSLVLIQIILTNE